MRLSYDGTSYHGWQSQPSKNTIQDRIEYALSKLLGKETSIQGASRTDAGVHAREQVAHFQVERSLDRDLLKRRLNLFLEADITILSIEQVDESFHARYGVKEKSYIYTINTTGNQWPFERRFAHRIDRPMHLRSITSCFDILIGRHSFRAFTNKASTVRNFVRSIYDLSLLWYPSGIQFLFRGNGFLYKMIRNIVGLLIDVGLGKFIYNDVVSIISSGDRSLLGAPAPSKGLTLVKVSY